MHRVRLVLVAGWLAMVLGCAHEPPAAEPVAPRGAVQSRTLSPPRVSSPLSVDDPPPSSASDDEPSSPVAVVSAPDGRVPAAPSVIRDGRPPWMQAIRACGPADKAAAKKHPLGADPVELGRIVAAEGRLTPGSADCTLIGCQCCNSCGFDWEFVPRHDCPDRRFRIQRTVDRLPLAGGGWECEVRRMGAYTMEVLAIGRMAGKHDLIADVELCRIAASMTTVLNWMTLTTSG